MLLIWQSGSRKFDPELGSGVTVDEVFKRPFSRPHLYLLAAKSCFLTLRMILSLFVLDFMSSSDITNLALCDFFVSFKKHCMVTPAFYNVICS